MLPRLVSRRSDAGPSLPRQTLGVEAVHMRGYLYVPTNALSPMQPPPDIARLIASRYRVAHCVLPPWRDEEINSVSRPGSIGVAFTPQRAAIVRWGNGRAMPRDVEPNTVGIGGHEPLVWLDVDAPSDVIEITADPELRRDIAEELHVPHHADLDDLPNWADPVIVAIAMRLRAGIRDWVVLSDVEEDTFVWAAYCRVLQQKFGGRTGRTGKLDAARCARVMEFIAENLHRELTLAELADAAMLSPSHFARSFQRTTGLPPHRLVTILRLQRAADRLKDLRLTVEDVAAEVGMTNLSHFRRLFRAQYGVPPSALRG
jgi:AraC family transcriptional regulator